MPDAQSKQPQPKKVPAPPSRRGLPSVAAPADRDSSVVGELRRLAAYAPTLAQELHRLALAVAADDDLSDQGRRRKLAKETAAKLKKKAAWPRKARRSPRNAAASTTRCNSAFATPPASSATPSSPNGEARSAACRRRNAVRFCATPPLAGDQGPTQSWPPPFPTRHPSCSAWRPAIRSTP